MKLFLPSGPIIAMVLAKENSILEWRDLLGPTSSHRARETHPDRFLKYLFRGLQYCCCNKNTGSGGYNTVVGPKFWFRGLQYCCCSYHTGSGGYNTVVGPKILVQGGYNTVVVPTGSGGLQYCCCSYHTGSGGLQ